MLQCGFVRENFSLPIYGSCGSLGGRGGVVLEFGGLGAGEGNRTLIASLEGWCSTIELHPPAAVLHPVSLAVGGGGGRIRTYVDVSRQIYSLLPLTARPPLRAKAPKQNAGGIWSFPNACQQFSPKAQRVAPPPEIPARTGSARPSG